MTNHTPHDLRFDSINNVIIIYNINDQHNAFLSCLSIFLFANVIFIILI
jgi:hypothetical protein